MYSAAYNIFLKRMLSQSRVVELIVLQIMNTLSLLNYSVYYLRKRSKPVRGVGGWVGVVLDENTYPGQN